MKPVHKDWENACFSNPWIPTQSYETNEEKGKHSPRKEQNKFPETYPKEMEIYELSGKEFKIKMLYELKKTMHERNDKIKK